MPFSVETVNIDLNLFTVRLVMPGEPYGLNMMLTNDSGQPYVEFYDRDYDYCKEADGKILGQFVSRYYFSTLLTNYDGSRGINLEGRVKKWRLDKDALTFALEACIEALGFDKWKIHEAAFCCTVFDFPRFSDPLKS